MEMSREHGEVLHDVPTQYGAMWFTVFLAIMLQAPKHMTEGS